MFGLRSVKSLNAPSMALAGMVGVTRAEIELLFDLLKKTF